MNLTIVHEDSNETMNSSIFYEDSNKTYAHILFMKIAMTNLTELYCST